MSDNYGSIATNYALYRVIHDMGRRPAILDHLVTMGSEAIKFAREYMQLCSGFMERNDWQSADQCFETFVVGSDMTWNWKLNRGRPFQYMMLGFADETKRMISYAPSFGAKKEEKEIDEGERILYSYYLKRFDAISVREDYGVDMCRDLFDVQAEQVLDPVLLCDGRIWKELSARSQLGFDKEYLLAYILEATPNKRQMILEAAKSLNTKIVLILDFEVNYEGNKRVMNMNENIVRPGFIDWLAYFHHASYVITDSMHGTCFSVLFQKKFVAVKSRSKERFDSLAKLIECPDLFYEDGALPEGKTNIFSDIDYELIYKRIERKQAESREWLWSALDTEIKPKSSSESTRLALKLFRSRQEKMDLLNKIKVKYAYEEEQKEEVAAQLQAGKTWFGIISLKNNVVFQNSKLREINNIHDYFAMLKADLFKYVIVLSGRDECATYRGKFLEASDLFLRTDVGWRNSYIAVIDEGVIRIDEKSDKELHMDYEFVTGHPDYHVEYLDHKLKVCCEPLRYCRIKIKSKGFTGSPGRDRSEIIVHNIDYSMNRIGINVVIIDKETGAVLDSMNINTYSDAGLKINRG